MSTSIQCRATRHGKHWVTHIPEHGMYGHGRTLKSLRHNVIDGLAYIGVTAQVTVIAVTPELEILRSIEEIHASALAEAVDALALRSATPADIAHATRTSPAGVRALLADRSAPEASQDSAPPPDQPATDTEFAPAPPVPTGPVMATSVDFPCQPVHDPEHHRNPAIAQP